MMDDEEKLLQAVALQNANSIFLARQRAEQELIRTKEALEAKTELLAQSLEHAKALLDERDRARAEAEDARRAAQTANDAKDRFLTIISHELRTPLGAIGGYAALLEEGIRGELTEGQREYVERIRYSQKHILRLVNELLDFAKIESGQFVLNVGNVPVKSVLDSVQTLIGPQIQASRLELQIALEDATVLCRADQERVEQIVLNLLSNAVKFTAAGGIVMVKASSTEDIIRVQVADTGIGIPADKLDAVFEPFVQLEPTPALANHGTGLGLAISRHLARLMGGDLTAESARGKGSTFTLTLARALEAATISA